LFCTESSFAFLNIFSRRRFMCFCALYTTRGNEEEE